METLLDDWLIQADAMLVVDERGHHWCALKGGGKFGRISGKWFYSTGQGPVREVTVPSTIAALDAWEAQSVDHCPPQGLPRLVLLNGGAA
jgi:hypothetical protein